MRCSSCTRKVGQRLPLPALLIVRDVMSVWCFCETRLLTLPSASRTPGASQGPVLSGAQVSGSLKGSGVQLAAPAAAVHRLASIQLGC